MARPRNDAVTLEDRIETQTTDWLKVSSLAAKIANLQAEGFLKQVASGDLAPKAHIEIAEVMERIVNGASHAIQAGTKLLAARKVGNGVTEQLDEAALAEELHGKVG